MVCAPDEMLTPDDVPYGDESYIYDRLVSVADEMSSVPASLVVKTYDGDEFFVGLLIGFPPVIVGAVVSIINSGIVSVPGLPAASVTVMIISEYVPGDNVSNVIVLLMFALIV